MLFRSTKNWLPTLFAENLDLPMCKGAAEILLGGVMQKAVTLMYRYRVEYLKEEQTRNLLVSEHEELVKAIREGDVQKAQDISFHHLENQRKAIIRTIRAENEAKEAEKKE